MRKKILLIITILLTATQGAMAMQIFVKTITNRTITIDVDNSSVTIYSVKEKIWEKEGYSVESQILLSNGIVLDNDKTLDFYGIGRESIIDLRIAVAPAVQVRELTKNAQGNWVLSGMPDWSGRLEVTFYEQYRLDSIPLTWTVMVNNVDRTQEVTPYTEGDTTKGRLMVYEGAAVELVPPTEVKPDVKRVDLNESTQE